MKNNVSQWLKYSIYNHRQKCAVLHAYSFWLKKCVCLQLPCTIVVPRKNWWKQWLYTVQAIFHLAVWLHKACLSRTSDCPGAWIWKSIPKMIAAVTWEKLRPQIRWPPIATGV
jgi:hypothetical protein